MNLQSELQIPADVNLKKKKDILFFNGPLGHSQININKLDKKGYIAFQINQEKKIIQFTSSEKATFYSFVNMVKKRVYGLSQGYIKTLRLVGIGYRYSLHNDVLTLKIGFSHKVKYKIPNSIRFFLIKNTLLSIFGVDKNQVNQIAVQIRGIRPPSPYKGKGIRFVQESVQLKQGKQK